MDARTIQKSGDINVEQYLVMVRGEIYALSFFIGKKAILNYEQLFSEIAYSFMLNQSA